MSEALARVAESDRWSDAELLMRVKEGRAATADLLLRHTGLMIESANRVLKNKDDVLDAVQEASMKATQAIHSCDGNVKGWLGRIASNEALNIVRARQNHGGGLVDPNLIEARDPEPVEELVSQESASWTARSIAFLVECANAVVDGLPEREKTALLLRYKKKLSSQQIAEHFKTSIDAIYMLHNRAKLSFGKALAEMLLRYLSESTG